VLGGVEPKAEIASDDEMSDMSECPSDDIPNQEKNQYRTVRIYSSTREIKKRINKNS